ncbi:MAG TPA: RidA family protein [Myxococcales bacterium]|nr:RidA family protein [Myxococcales bacterium]
MSDKRIQVIHPKHFAPAKGYANGMLSSGRTLHIAGQIGWNADQKFESDDLIAQFAQALDNILAVLSAAGGTPTDLVKMTIYITDMATYRSRARELGPLWKDRLGRHYPAMALVRVMELVEPQAKIEIEAVVSLPTESV